MNFPCPVSTLLEWIPHRPPMVWIDRVLSAKDGEGECDLTLKHGALYMKENEAHGVAAVEWIAQAYMFVQIAHALGRAPNEKKEVAEAYLVGVTDAKWTQLPKAGETLKIQVVRDRTFGPISIIKGTVRNGTGQDIASASLKVFAR